MKIRFLKNISVDVETRHDEYFDRAYAHWQEIQVEGIYPCDKFATITLDNGDVLHGVPVDAFERLQEEKRTLSI